MKDTQLQCKSCWCHKPKEAFSAESAGLKPICNTCRAKLIERKTHPHSRTQSYRPNFVNMLTHI